MHLSFEFIDASAAEWAKIYDDNNGYRDQSERPAPRDDAPATKGPWVEAGDWGDLAAPDGVALLEDDGWVRPWWDDEVVQPYESPVLAVVALVVAVVALASVVWLHFRRRRVVVVSERPLEFSLGLGLAGGDGVVPPAKCKGSTA